MSLFGSSPDDSSFGNSAQRSKASLFADEPATNTSSSLFADENNGSSPRTTTNANKRASRHELVKALLPGTDVPDSYVDAYDRVLDVGERVGAGVGLTPVREILSGSGLSATDQERIVNLVVASESDGGGNGNIGVGRGEFNVLLALVGLAQEGEELTLDAVDDRRKNLPVPESAYLDRLRANQEPEEDAAAQAAQSEREQQVEDAPMAAAAAAAAEPTQEPRTSSGQLARRESLGGLESDPWAAPDLHRGHDHQQAENEEPAASSWPDAGAFEEAYQRNLLPNGGRPNGQAEVAPVPPASSGSGWGGSLGTTPASDVGFGGLPPGVNPIEPTPRRGPLGPPQIASPSAVQETVTVTLLPEKEGLFMFQHRNYEVKSARRASTVIRRYSDFVWLLDCLHRRYPFRQLPLLPPKRISVNGTHLAADSTSFLEKRRRGLVRFTNALVRHPVLGQEQLVVMFLTVPTELSVWRKQASISVQDEFTGKVLPPDQEDSLPATLTDTMETVRNGVKRSAEIYINLCTLLERMAKRNEGLAADHLRFSLGLQSLTEATRDTYTMQSNDIPSLNEGIRSTARHLCSNQSLLEDEARAWGTGVLEDLKQQRDCLVSMRELFDRRDRYARNNIAQLERRIETNERKLQDFRARPTGTVKPGEIERVEESIFKDKESIVHQHARGVFIRQCLREEMEYFHQSQYHITRLHQDWSQERVKYSELQADNWRSLSDQVERMPDGI